MNDEEVRQHLQKKGCLPFPIGSFIPRWDAQAQWPWRRKCHMAVKEPWELTQQLNLLMGWSSWAWQVMHREDRKKEEENREDILRPMLFSHSEDPSADRRRDVDLSVHIENWGCYLAQPQQFSELNKVRTRARANDISGVVRFGDPGYWKAKIKEGHRKWEVEWQKYKKGERKKAPGSTTYPNDFNPCSRLDHPEGHYRYRCLCNPLVRNDRRWGKANVNKTLNNALIFLSLFHAHLGLVVPKNAALMVACVHNNLIELLKSLAEERGHEIAKEQVDLAKSLLDSMLNSKCNSHWFECLLDEAKLPWSDLCEEFYDPYPPDVIIQSLSTRFPGRLREWENLATLARECAACLTDPQLVKRMDFDAGQVNSLIKKLGDDRKAPEGQTDNAELLRLPNFDFSQIKFLTKEAEHYQEKPKRPPSDPAKRSDQIWALRASSKYFRWVASVVGPASPDDDIQPEDSTEDKGVTPVKNRSTNGRGRGPVALLCAASPQQQMVWDKESQEFANAMKEQQAMPALQLKSPAHPLALAAEVKGLLIKRCAAIHIVCEEANVDAIDLALHLALSGEALVYASAYAPIALHVMLPHGQPLKEALSEFEAKAADIVDLLEIEAAEDDTVPDVWEEFDALQRAREEHLRQELSPKSQPVARHSAHAPGALAANDSAVRARADTSAAPPWFLGVLSRREEQGLWHVNWQPRFDWPRTLNLPVPHLWIAMDGQAKLLRIHWEGGHAGGSLVMRYKGHGMMTWACRKTSQGGWQFVIRPEDIAGLDFVSLLGDDHEWLIRESAAPNDQERGT